MPILSGVPDVPNLDCVARVVDVVNDDVGGKTGDHELAGVAIFAGSSSMGGMIQGWPRR